MSTFVAAVTVSLFRAAGSGGAMDESSGDVSSATSGAEGPPGSQGSGLGGGMEAGPNAGAGPGGPEDEQDVPIPPLTEGVTADGPSGPQDSSLGDLDEPG